MFTESLHTSNSKCDIISLNISLAFEMLRRNILHHHATEHFFNYILHCKSNTKLFLSWT